MIHAHRKTVVMVRYRHGTFDNADGTCKPVSLPAAPWDAAGSPYSAPGNAAHNAIAAVGAAIGAPQGNPATGRWPDRSSNVAGRIPAVMAFLATRQANMLEIAAALGCGIESARNVLLELERRGRVTWEYEMIELRGDVRRYKYWRLVDEKRAAKVGG